MVEVPQGQSATGAPWKLMQIDNVSTNLPMNKLMQKGTAPRKVWHALPNAELTQLEFMKACFRYVQDVSMASKTLDFNKAGKLDQRDSGADRYILDTGSGNHLVSIEDITQADLDDATQAEDPIYLDTANGQITVKKRVLLQVLSLMLVINALILPRTPAVLSVGRLTMEEDFDFLWFHRQIPWLIDKHGNYYPLEVEKFVPLLTEKRCAAKDVLEFSGAMVANNAAKARAQIDKLMQNLKIRVFQMSTGAKQPVKALDNTWVVYNLRTTTLLPSKAQVVPTGLQVAWPEGMCLSVSPLQTGEISDRVLWRNIVVSSQIADAGELGNCGIVLCNLAEYQVQIKAGTALGKLVLQRSYTAKLDSVKTAKEAQPTLVVEATPTLLGAEASSSSAGSSTDPPPPEMTADQKLRIEATSTRHLALHKPKNKYCEFCMKSNYPRKQAVKGNADENTGHSEFGELVLGDHIVLGKDLEISADGDRVALALMDSATDWADVFPAKSKSTEDSTEGLGGVQRNSGGEGVLLR